jgi:hypothetical protein
LAAGQGVLEPASEIMSNQLMLLISKASICMALLLPLAPSEVVGGMLGGISPALARLDKKTIQNNSQPL